MKTIKKSFLLILAVAVLVLAACQSATQGQQNTQPPTTTAPTQTTAAPTETTSPIASAPTEPTEDLMAVYEEFQAYVNGNINCMGWKYTGEPHPNPIFDNVNTSDLEPGCFYLVFFDEDGGYTEHYLIADSQVAYYTTTSEHCYYTMVEDQSKIYRSDLNGEKPTLVYESNSTIKDIGYFGSNSEGKLMFVEVMDNGDRIVSYDLSNQQTQVLMEAYLIELFRYSPTSRVWNTTTEQELGATIYWMGKISENDSNNGYGSNPAYYYVVETGEHCYYHLW